MTLRELRRAAGLTATAMGDRMGMTHQGVTRTERENGPGLNGIKRYVEALGGTVTVTVSIGGEQFVLTPGGPK